MTASSVFAKAGVLSTWHTALITIIIIIIIIINVSLKYITNVTESKGIRIMKIALIVYNYYIKPNKTLDIYIVKLPSCIETLFY